jgi:hypothetical protein
VTATDVIVVLSALVQVVARLVESGASRDQVLARIRHLEADVRVIDTDVDATASGR